MIAALSLERAAEVVLAVMLAEAAFLVWRYRRRQSGLSPAAVARLLLPGAFLVLALRLGQELPAAWPALLLCLGAAFATHLNDLRHRKRESDPNHALAARTRR